MPSETSSAQQNYSCPCPGVSMSHVSRLINLWKLLDLYYHLERNEIRLHSNTMFLQYSTLLTTHPFVVGRLKIRAVFVLRKQELFHPLCLTHRRRFWPQFTEPLRRTTGEDGSYKKTWISINT